MKLARGLLGLVLAGVLAGCGAAGLIRRGDALILANRPSDAARVYMQALQKDPDLSQDPVFLSKLSRAQSQAQYRLGQALASEGRWDEAIQAFRDSSEADPAFAGARQALDWAKVQASKAHYRQALALADQGQADPASQELQRAIELDPANPDARLALDSLGPKADGSHPQQLYEQSLSLEKEKRYGDMARLLEAALAENPHHIPARLARARAKAAVAAATSLCSSGARLLADGQLDQAIADLKKALDIWPLYQDAAQFLGQATARRQEAETMYRKAVELAGQRKWDEAQAAAAAALDVFPYHQQAAALLADSKRQAAEACCETGRGLLAKGEPGAAEASFRRALAYVPDFTGALDGLSQADFARGQAAEQQGLLGNSLIWYLRAADHLSKAQYETQIRAVRARILQRARIAVRPQVVDAAGWRSTAVAALDANLAARLSASRPGILSVLAQGAAAQMPIYDARVELVGLEVRTDLVRSESRAHAYTVRREVLNPEIPRLRDALIAAQREMLAAQAEFNRPCRECRGDGRLECPSCRGKGKAKCPYCQMTGKRPCRTCKGSGKQNGHVCPTCRGSGTRVCATCGGDGWVACSKCRGKGWATCGRCDGTGRAGNVTELDLRRLERCVDDLRLRLHREPPIVLADFPAAWPYTVGFHRKAGAGEVALQVVDTATGTVVRADRIRKTNAFEDATIDNPNPAVGLGPDPLVLPSDATVSEELVDKLAEETAAKLVAAVVGARAAELKARAEASSRQGNDAQAVEALVDLARTIEDIAAQEAATIIERLKQEGGNP